MRGSAAACITARFALREPAAGGTCPVRVVLLTHLLLATAAPALSQSGEVPRTPWGDPDLGGYWDYRTITPWERPPDLAEKARLTPEEADRYETEFNAGRAIEGDYDMIQQAAGAGPAELQLVLNWDEELKARVPVN